MRRVRAAESTATSVYVDAFSNGRREFGVRVAFQDTAGRQHNVTFPAHLLPALIDNANLAHTVIQREAPETLIHPLLRNR